MSTNPPCRHRQDEADGYCTCISDKLVLPPSGRFRVSACSSCPYSEAPGIRGVGDLVELGLKAVGITKKRVEAVTGKPCGCKARQERMNALLPFGVPEEQTEPVSPPDELQFIWVYWDGGASLDELRYSMRSVEANYQGKAKLTIIGDCPLWWKGHHIPQPKVKVSDAGFQKGLRDVLAKMDTLSRHPDVQDEFIWMMDDVFMVQPCSYADMVQGRAAPSIKRSRGNRWQSIKTNTANRLERNGYTTYDYGTHLPHHVEKAKLAEMFETWKPLEHLFLWEVVYGNIYRGKPASHVPFLRRVGLCVSEKQYDKWGSQNHFINVAANGWGNPLRNWLLTRFPAVATGEWGAIPQYKSDQVRNEPIDDHIVLIHSAYNDADISRYRLALSEQTVFPALQQQTARVKLQVAICEDDPLLEERKQLFVDTGHEVEFIPNQPPKRGDLYSAQWNLPIGPRNLVGRIDDDDIIPIDFFAISRDKAAYCDVEGVLVWPNGYVRHGGEWYTCRHEGNQFLALVSRWGACPHDHDHRTFDKAWAVLHAEHSRGWIWVRHDEAITTTKRRYLKNKGGQLNVRRFPFDFSEL